MSELGELLERFRRGPELLAAALTGAAGAEVDYRANPSSWSVRTIVAHLADAELVGAERYRRVIAEDHPVLEAFDEKLWAERLDYARRKPSQSLESFRRVRTENYELLKELAPELFGRTGRHTERGTVTLLEMLRGGAEHAESHTQQIQAVRAAYKSSKAS